MYSLRLSLWRGSRRQHARPAGLVVFGSLLLLILFQLNTFAQDQLSRKTISTADGQITQPQGNSPQGTTVSTEAEIDKLKTTVADQQKRIEQLEQTLYFGL